MLRNCCQALRLIRTSAQFPVIKENGLIRSSVKLQKNKVQVLPSCACGRLITLSRLQQTNGRACAAKL